MRKYLLAVLFMTIPLVMNNTFAQIITTEGQALMDKYYHKAMVSLVDEFFNRFNGNTSHPDIDVSDPEKRQKNLISLFDFDYLGSCDAEKIKEIEDFADLIIKKNFKINYSDSTWFAVATCNATLNSKSVEFKVILTVETIREDIYKWVISKVSGSIFETAPANAGIMTILEPDVHETNFMALGKMTKEQPKNVSAFLHKGHKYDATDIFAYLVYTKQLTINYVKKLEFVFTQIPGYIFNVEKKIRDNNNSGWLITNLYVSDPKNTRNIIDSTYRSRYDVSRDFVTDSYAVDSVTKTNIETTYNICTMQQMIQINDYITFIQASVNKTTKNYYIDKLKQMFIDDAMVLVKSGDEYKDKMPLASFCENLSNNKIECVSIDFITAPKINVSDILSNPQSDYINCKAFTCPFMSMDNKTNVESSQTLMICKKETFLGTEWYPKFGNISVTIKKKK